MMAHTHARTLPLLAPPPCSILSIHVESTNKVTNEHTHSVLHVIDLAGSERLAHSNAVGAGARCTHSLIAPWLPPLPTNLPKLATRTAEWSL
jgi:hypothetical protein